jgi:hypothetical protein
MPAVRLRNVNDLMEIMHGLVLLLCHKCGHLRFSHIICLTENKGNDVGRSISSGSRFECGFGLDFFNRDENDIKLSDIKSLAHKCETNFFSEKLQFCFCFFFLQKRSSLNPDLHSNKNGYFCKIFLDTQFTALFSRDCLIGRVAWPI